MKPKIKKILLIAIIIVFGIYIAIPKKQAAPPPQEQAAQQQPEVPEHKKIHDFPSPDDKYLPGETPEKAWESLLQVWKDKQESPNLKLYTETGKFVRPGYFAYTEEPVKVRKKDGYAVVLPENSDLPPFLFCKTEEGWKFDAVHQQKHIKTAGSKWGVERYISPYSHILRKLPVYDNADIPLKKEDIYRLSNDAELAKQLIELEDLYYEGKMTSKKATELGRLYVMTAQDAKAIEILNKAKEKMPENPEIYRYLATAYINSGYQYDLAEKEIAGYIKLVPEDAFGHNFKGYLLLKGEKKAEAEAEFKKALEYNPQDCYALTKLGRFKESAKSCKGEEYERFIWLVQLIHSS